MFSEETFRKKTTVYPGAPSIDDERRAVIQSNSPSKAEQFIRKYCEKVNNLAVNNVYFFHYDAKLADKLREWDYNPCSYIYDTVDVISGTNYMGLNIHFINSLIKRRNTLNGNMLSGKDYEKAVKEYIPTRATEIYLVPKKFYDVVCLTRGKIYRRKRI